MDPPPEWYSLPSFPGLPALLVSARFTASSYTFHVTDLANIWVEKLDRRGILLRSLQENTSIDLVDAAAEQWDVFLSKLKAAFDRTSPDHHLTTISLESHAKSQDGLTLRITCQLPKPLEALVWPIHLTKCEPASLASELALPLIQEHYVRCREAEDLMTQLKEKDAVIKKLVDKLDSMRTPLELIFNSLSAKHVTTRAAAEEKIKGLAPFNEDRWRSQRSRELPQDVQALLQNVFGGSCGFTCATGMGLGVSDTLNDWFTKIAPGPHVGVHLEEPTSREDLNKSQDDEAMSGYAQTDVEDFQVQATPPPRWSQPVASKKDNGGKLGDDATESDDSDFHDSHPIRLKNKPKSKVGAIGGSTLPTRDHSASQSSRTVRALEDDTPSESEGEMDKSAPSKGTKQLGGKLGMIGKSGQSSQPITELPVAEPAVGLNDETASDSDPGGGRASPAHSPPVAKPTTPRKGALGRIGGKRKVATSPQASRQSTPDTASNDPAPPRRTAGKLGTIGTKPGPASERMHSEVPANRGEPETDEMKAERKRAELTRELNRNAVPAKKKRKF